MKGWMHRDFVMQPDAKPLTAEVTFDKVPEGYGKQTTPEEVVSRGKRANKRKPLSPD